MKKTLSILASTTFLAASLSSADAATVKKRSVINVTKNVTVVVNTTVNETTNTVTVTTSECVSVNGVRTCDNSPLTLTLQK